MIHPSASRDTLAAEANALNLRQLLEVLRKHRDSRPPLSPSRMTHSGRGVCIAAVNTATQLFLSRAVLRPFFVA